MRFVTDSGLDTIRIPVTILRGRIVNVYDGRPPTLVAGTIGDLIVPALSVENSKWVGRLQRKEISNIFPGSSELLAAVNVNVPERLRHRTIERSEIDLAEPLAAANSCFVTIRLEEPLRMQLRGTKKARLLSCLCYVAALDSTFASINEAYTAISRRMEPQRRSHGGNVFTSVYRVYPETKLAAPLANIRQRLQEDYERRNLLTVRKVGEEPTGEPQAPADPPVQTTLGL